MYSNNSSRVTGDIGRVSSVVVGDDDGEGGEGGGGGVGGIVVVHDDGGGGGSRFEGVLGAVLPFILLPCDCCTLFLG